MKPIRILVVEDEPLFREMLCRTLMTEPGVEVVGEATDGESAVRLASQLDPDAVIMDIELPGDMDGIDAALKIKERRLRTGIVILSIHKDRRYVSSLPLSENPGWAYLLKQTVPDLASVMRILQPPRRVVALDGDRAAVAVVGAPPGSGKLRIVERRNNSAVWQERARLDPSEGSSNDQFGSALALRSDRVLVGAPRHAESGAAFVFARDAATGQWREEAKLTASDLALESRFGTALAFDGEDILVGAPGTDQSGGTVVIFSRDATSGEWRERGRTVPIQATGRLVRKIQPRHVYIEATPGVINCQISRPMLTTTNPSPSPNLAWPLSPSRSRS